MAKKGQNYKPLNESEYTDIEVNGFTDCEPLDDGIEIKVFSFSDQDDISNNNTQNIIKRIEYTKSNSSNTKYNHKSENKETSSLAQIQKYNAKEVFFMGEMVTLITNVGFPIAVATYLLIRFETKIDGLTKAITDLSAVVTQHSNYKGDDKVA